MRIGRAHCGVETTRRLNPTIPSGIHTESRSFSAVTPIPARSIPIRESPTRQNSVSASSASPTFGFAGSRFPGCRRTVAVPRPQKRLRESPAAAFSRLSVIVHSMRAIRVVSWGFVVRTVAASRSIEEESRGERREACRISASASRRSSPANESEALLVNSNFRAVSRSARLSMTTRPRARIRPRSRFLSAERRQLIRSSASSFPERETPSCNGKVCARPSSPPRTSYGTRRADRPAGSSPRHRPEYRYAHP